VGRLVINIQMPPFVMSILSVRANLDAVALQHSGKLRGELATLAGIERLRCSIRSLLLEMRRFPLEYSSAIQPIDGCGGFVERFLQELCHVL